jgi:hypothetical protein
MSSSCRLFTIIIALTILVIFFAALVINEDKQFPSFRVKSASLSQLTVNGSRILESEKMSAALNITLSVSNPILNFRIFETLDVEVFYMDEYGDNITLNTSTIQPFNGSKIELKLKVDSYEPLHLAESIVLSRNEHGRVEFGIKVFTSIRFKNDIFDSDWIPLKAVCYPLSFAISRNVYDSTPAALLQGVTCTRT